MKTLNRTSQFILITFGLSFSIAGIYHLFGGSYSNPIAFTILGSIYMFMPTISVLILKKLFYHEKLSPDLMISFNVNKWFLVAWLSMPIIVFLTVGISLLFPEFSYNQDMSGMVKRFESILTPEQLVQMKDSFKSMPFNPMWLILFQGLFAGISINAIAAFGEELGWRGFLLHEFKEMSFLKASVLIGIIWGLWHAPLILMGHNYPQHPRFGVIMMVFFCVLLSPLFTYITIKSKSVIAAAVMHGTMNATFGISIMMVNGGNDLIGGIAGLMGFITLSICLVLLFIFDTYISKDKILTSKINKHI